MKKRIAVLLLIVMAMSLVACGGANDSGTNLVKVGETTINESELAPPSIYPSNPAISPSSGKRFISFLENTFFPSTVTSKTPPVDGSNSTSTLEIFFNSSSNLEARG